LIDLTVTAIDLVMMSIDTSITQSINLTVTAIADVYITGYTVDRVNSSEPISIL